MIEVAGSEFRAELEVVAVPGCAGTDAAEHRGPVGRQVHRFRDDAKRLQQLAVFVPRPPGPEGEVKDHVCTGPHQIQQAFAQRALDVAVYIWRQGHRGDAARPGLLIEGQADHSAALKLSGHGGFPGSGRTAHEDDTSHEVPL
jgi:hypothetical protein